VRAVVHVHLSPEVHLTDPIPTACVFSVFDEQLNYLFAALSSKQAREFVIPIEQ
jgi:hypothetical protein